MPNRYEALVSTLKNKSLSFQALDKILQNTQEQYTNLGMELEFLKLSGIPLEFKGNSVSLKTTQSKINESCFCVVDIETNGSSPNNSQIIEIGAIKYQNGKIIDTFKQLIYCNTIPQSISEITGITTDMLQDAPKLGSVLSAFKLFLQDCVFVAHNVSFDYNFLSILMAKAGLGYLYNPKICTIKLAQATFPSMRYGLSYLNESLGICHLIRHRAFDDAQIALKVFEYSLDLLPKEIVSTQELIDFTQTKQLPQKYKQGLL